MLGNKWIIVSNRLPFTYDQNKKEIVKSSGGLVTAISGINNSKRKIWVGTVPDNIPKDILENFIKENDSEFYFHPVFIPQKLYHEYYNNYCNRVLWPLFHYESELVRYEEKSYQAYEEVNKIFALEILKIADPEDLLWVNDFHFFLLPKYIKDISSKIKIGHFLHIPFPNCEIFKQLPNRAEILEGLLGSDLVGFHDSSYLRYFSSSVQRILGHEADLMHIKTEKRNVKLGVFPVSINTNEFIEYAKSPEVSTKGEKIKKEFKDKKIILSLDRMDYSKGLLLKLKSYNQFLADNPSWVGKVEMIMVAIPSRQDIEEYKNLKRDVELLISEINGKYSHLNYLPIRYLFKSISKDELVALYRKADTMFITSKRDGMNLVALEYVCCQDEKNPGSVVISEFAGAASMLSGAHSINPWNTKETSDTLKYTLEKGGEEKRASYEEMIRFLKTYTSTKWAENFMGKIPHQENIIEGWKEEALDLLSCYQMRLPDSYIEEEHYSITWNYSEENQIFADFLATKLTCELEEGLGHYPVEVKKMKDSIRIKMKGFMKPIFIHSRDFKSEDSKDLHPALVAQMEYEQLNFKNEG